MVVKCLEKNLAHFAQLIVEKKIKEKDLILETLLLQQQKQKQNHNNRNRVRLTSRKSRHNQYVCPSPCEFCEFALRVRQTWFMRLFVEFYYYIIQPFVVEIMGDSYNVHCNEELLPTKFCKEIVLASSKRSLGK